MGPRLIELQGEINTLPVVAADVSTHPSVIEIQQAENQYGYSQLNSTINQLSLIDIYRLFHPVAVKWPLFSSSYGTLAATEYILGL